MTTRFLARRNVAIRKITVSCPSLTRLGTTSKEPRAGIRTPCKRKRTEGTKLKDQLQVVPSRDGALGPAVPFPLLGARLRGSRGFQRLGSALRDHTTYHKQHRTCAIRAGPSVGTFGVSFPLLKRGTRGTWLPTHLAQLEVFLAIDGHCIPDRYSLWKAKKSRSRTASRGYHPSITPRPAV